MKNFLLAAIAALGVGSAANAAILVDGAFDSAYGPSVAALGPAGTAPFSVYLKADAGKVYGFLKTETTGAPTSALLGFDLDPANDNGSDIVFDVVNGRARSPLFKNDFTESLDAIEHAISDDGLGIEFSLDNSLFFGPIGDLFYFDDQEFPQLGSTVTLAHLAVFGNLSWMLNGNARPSLVLTDVAAPDVSEVPEPESLAMMVAAFGLLGGSLRYRRAAIRQV